MRRRWFLLLSLLALTLVLFTGGILWHSVEMFSISEIQTRVDTMRPVFTGIRLFLIAGMAMAWPYLVGGLHRWGRIDEVQATTMRALRWRIVIWLVVIELVLGQNLLSQVFTVLQGSRG